MTQFDDTLVDEQLGELHRVEEEKLIQTIAKKNGYRYVDLHHAPISVEALRRLPEGDARRAEAVIFAQTKETVSIAIRNPKNPEVPALLERIKSEEKTPVIYLATLNSISFAWKRYNDIEESITFPRGVLDVDPELIKRIADDVKTYLDVGEKVIALQKENSVTRTTKALAIIFGSALSLDASDIHIEPEKLVVRIRFRLDGVLHDICDIDKDLYHHFISRLKLLSGLKLNVKNEAQDGRFTFKVREREIEVRASVIPGGYGESMVMRLLDPDALSFNIERLGLNAKLYDIILDELKRPNGAIITTGPTGSGKTSALYTFLVTIHNPGTKIVTLEDPIEYKLKGLVQTQVDDEYTFELGLRSILRQDPDVILVGEIRDPEVARTALQAALTGHLVFSTLHTNSAFGSFARLMSLGVDPSTIGSACNIMLGQRLVRLLCPTCKVEREITMEEHAMMQRILGVPFSIHTTFDAHGCDACAGIGYKGRTGVFEAIQIDNAIREVIRIDVSDGAIRKAAAHQGIPTMQQDGIYKVLAGMTSIDEVSRVLDLYHDGK